jgi:hypothetical protein
MCSNRTALAAAADLILDSFSDDVFPHDAVLPEYTLKEADILRHELPGRTRFSLIEELSREGVGYRFLLTTDALLFFFPAALVGAILLRNQQQPSATTTFERWCNTLAELPRERLIGLLEQPGGLELLIAFSVYCGAENAYTDWGQTKLLMALTPLASLAQPSQQNTPPSPA